MRPDRGRGGRRFPIGRTRPGLGARAAPVGGGGRRRHGCAPASPHPALQAATSTSPGYKTENKKKSTPSCRGERNVGVVGRVPASSPLRPPGRRSGVARATQVATGHGLDAQTRRRTHGCALTRRARKCPDRTTREGVCKKSSQFCERAQRPPRQRSVQGAPGGSESEFTGVNCSEAAPRPGFRTDSGGQSRGSAATRGKSPPNAHSPRGKAARSSDLWVRSCTTKSAAGFRGRVVGEVPRQGPFFDHLFLDEFFEQFLKNCPGKEHLPQ